jgi:hypothetical protein
MMPYGSSLKLRVCHSSCAPLSVLTEASMSAYVAFLYYAKASLRSATTHPRLPIILQACNFVQISFLS